jgi:hypothetical protein
MGLGDGRHRLLEVGLSPAVDPRQQQAWLVCAERELGELAGGLLLFTAAARGGEDEQRQTARYR